MKTVEEITTAIRGKERFGYTTSTYTMVNDTLVRVSNHLPNVANIEENNENVEKIFLIFAECDLTESAIENYIEKELHNYSVEYMVIDNSFDFTTEHILSFINRM